MVLDFRPKSKMYEAVHSKVLTLALAFRHKSLKRFELFLETFSRDVSRTSKVIAASCLQRCSGLAATEQDRCKIVKLTSNINWATTLDCVLKQMREAAGGSDVQENLEMIKEKAWQRRAPSQGRRPSAAMQQLFPSLGRSS